MYILRRNAQTTGETKIRCRRCIHESCEADNSLFSGILSLCPDRNRRKGLYPLDNGTHGRHGADDALPAVQRCAGKYAPAGAVSAGCGHHHIRRASGRASGECPHGLECLGLQRSADEFPWTDQPFIQHVLVFFMYPGKDHLHKAGCVSAENLSGFLKLLLTSIIPCKGARYKHFCNFCALYPVHHRIFIQNPIVEGQQILQMHRNPLEYLDFTRKK